MGKGVGEVARMSRQLGVPCIGLAGTLVLEADAGGDALFTKVHGIVPDLTDAGEAFANPGQWLGRLAAKVARSLEA
jgi:glycerate kinase